MNRRKFLAGLPASVAGVYAAKFLIGCAGSVASAQPNPSPLRNYDYQLNYVPAFGQSLSFGAFGLPVISTTQRFDSLMFAGSLCAQSFNSDLAEDYGSLIPLVESNNIIGLIPSVQNVGIYHGETTESGMFEAIKELMESQDALTTQNINYRFLGSCPGRGGTAIVGLTVGSVPYQRVLYEVTQGMALAKAAGLTFGVPSITWMQGEADIDTTHQDYLDALLNMIQSFNSDIKAITGQSADVQFIMYQTAEAGCFQIATAQYQATQELTNAHIGTPCYPFQTDGAPWYDRVHLENIGYKWMGTYFGSAFKRLVINGESWVPLSPASFSVSGNVITLKLNVYGGASVVADRVTTTTTNPIKPALGFSLLNASGNALDIDDQVTVTGMDEITITAPETVGSGFTLNYGDTVDGYSGGNIRDNYGDQYVFNGGGLDIPMNNWLTVFSQQFS